MSADSRAYPHLSSRTNGSATVEPLLAQHNSSPFSKSLNYSPTSIDRTIQHRKTHKKKVRNTIDQLSETKKCIEVAAVYVKDAIRVRKPQTRIQDKGYEIQICNSQIVISPLSAYRFVHNKWWKWFLYIVIWTHLLCVIFAPKNYNTHKEADAFNNLHTVNYLYLLCIHP